MKLRAENIVKYYDKRPVVDGINIDLNQGEIVGLLGPNGAGKTTSFYIMVGLISPNEGNVYLEDDNITDLQQEIILNRHKIQCIVSNKIKMTNSIEFGFSQKPTLWDFPDGLDVMSFLQSY